MTENEKLYNGHLIFYLYLQIVIVWKIWISSSVHESWPEAWGESLCHLLQCKSDTMCRFSLTFSLNALCSHSTLSLLGRLAWRIILISPQASFGRRRIHSCLKFIKPIWRYIWKEMTLEAKRGGIGAANVDKMIPDDVHSQAVTWPYSWHAFEKDR